MTLLQQQQNAVAWHASQLQVITRQGAPKLFEQVARTAKVYPYCCLICQHPTLGTKVAHQCIPAHLIARALGEMLDRVPQYRWIGE